MHRNPKPCQRQLKRKPESARNHPQRAFTSLAHHLDAGWLQRAWERTRKDGAPGIDGCDAEHYAGDLQGNLADLLERAKSGSYRAPAVRRVYIPKGDGGDYRISDANGLLDFAGTVENLRRTQALLDDVESKLNAAKGAMLSNSSNDLGNLGIPAVTRTPDAIASSPEVA